MYIHNKSLHNCHVLCNVSIADEAKCKIPATNAVHFCCYSLAENSGFGNYYPSPTPPFFRLAYPVILVQKARLSCLSCYPLSCILTLTLLSEDFPVQLVRPESAHSVGTFCSCHRRIYCTLHKSQGENLYVFVNFLAKGLSGSMCLACKVVFSRRAL